MSMPQRPRDSQLANIIDKLAEFVARNGAEFEQMTKIKQQNNTKFAFLQPGSEFNSYYQYRLMEERRSLIGEWITSIISDRLQRRPFQECHNNLKTASSNSSSRISGPTTAHHNNHRRASRTYQLKSTASMHSRWSCKSKSCSRRRICRHSIR